MPFLSPNQQCLSTEGKSYHIPWTCSCQAHLRVFYPWLDLHREAPGSLEGMLPSLSSALLTPVPHGLRVTETDTSLN